MQMQDVVRLYTFALALQLLTLIPYALKAHEHSPSARAVVLRVLDTLSYSAPPGLPSILLLCGIVARWRLKRQGILLMFPEVLKRGAATDVVCFDKTGTLTHSTVSVLSHKDLSPDGHDAAWYL